MNCLVTGAAGFIGSHLSRKLLEQGWGVRGVDCFTDSYPRWIKEGNIAPLLQNKNFEFLPQDILELDLDRILQTAEAVFHLAAQAGVRTSWGENFSVYIHNNILATQKLLEAAKTRPVQKFVYASSSSVYGLTSSLPMSETDLLHPLSPYGVTKLAAEQLCFLYFKNYSVPTVSLRFFTVYGPGQRPDMAFHKFFKSIAAGKPITVFGSGKQTRDFTYVNDIVAACLAALRQGKQGEIYNVGGGHRETLEDIFPLLEDICHKKVKIRRADEQKGDVPHTFADIEKAKNDLQYAPRTQLREGLQEEWNWIRKLYNS
jgi:nucleoside-diphosphate-sugar epimerase